MAARNFQQQYYLGNESVLRVKRNKASGDVIYESIWRPMAKKKSSMHLPEMASILKLMQCQITK